VKLKYFFQLLIYILLFADSLSNSVMFSTNLNDYMKRLTFDLNGM